MSAGKSSPLPNPLEQSESISAALPPSAESSQPGTSQPGTSLSLLVQARLQNAAAWQQLLQIYTPLVGHWCRQSGLPDEDIRDAIQETFAAVLRGLPTFEHGGAGQSFRGWLRTIVRHRLIDLYRARATTPKAIGGTDAQLRLGQLRDPLADDQDADNPVETGLVFRAALEIIQGEFEPATAQAFWLSTVEERPPVEIAAELNISVNAVYKAKSRVLRRLREVLDGLE